MEGGGGRWLLTSFPKPSPCVALRKLPWPLGSSLFLLHLDPIVFSLTKPKGVCERIVKRIYF